MKNTLYIYTTESDRRLGRYKFGQTKRDAEQRIKEQDGTSNSEPLELIFSIDSDLSDHQVHDLLEHKGKKKTRRDNTDFTAYKKGGKVSSASKRADGIAQRGKTKGKIV